MSVDERTEELSLRMSGDDEEYDEDNPAYDDSDYEDVPDEDSNDDDDEEWSEDEEHEDWVTLGYAADKITADYIVDSLKAYDIPVIVNSKSGFLGDVGLTGIASPFGGDAAYQLLVPEENAEEALEIAEMTGGEKWESADSD